MEEYLKTLLEQIRCKQARGMVETEVRGHLEDQISENLLEGMKQEEAVKAAIKDMGDPVEVGISLDAVHRPQISWGIIVLIGIVSILSIVIQTVIGKNDAELGNAYAAKHMVHVLLGFVVMLGVYKLDYSFLGKHARLLAYIGIIGFIFVMHFHSVTINGASRWINVGALPFVDSISLPGVLYLWIPLFAGILYQYYGEGYKGVGKALIWMCVPVFLAVRMPYLSQGICLLLIQGILFSIAVGKGWFKVKKSRVIWGFWGTLAAMGIVPIVLGIRLGWFTGYQINRWYMYFDGKRDPYSVTYILGKIWKEGQWFGKGDFSAAQNLEGYYSDYLFSYLIQSYGIIATVLAAALIFALVWKCLGIARKQRNQLGMLVGYAGGILFLYMAVQHIAIGTGLIPPCGNFLPFVSSGGTNMVVSYAILGLILSVYRYQNILPPNRRHAPGSRRVLGKYAIPKV